MLLYFSKISPRKILYSQGEGTEIRDLLIVMMLVAHIAAAAYFL